MLRRAVNALPAECVVAGKRGRIGRLDLDAVGGVAGGHRGRVRAGPQAGRGDGAGVNHNAILPV